MCCMFRQSGVEEEVAFFPVTKQNFGKEVKIGEKKGLVQPGTGGISRNKE